MSVAQSEITWIILEDHRLTLNPQTPYKLTSEGLLFTSINAQLHDSFTCTYCVAFLKMAASLQHPVKME